MKKTVVARGLLLTLALSWNVTAAQAEIKYDTNTLPEPVDAVAQENVQTTLIQPQQQPIQSFPRFSMQVANTPETRADKIRREREQTEARTNDEALAKLEERRMKAEQALADETSGLAETAQQQQQQPVPPLPVQEEIVRAPIADAPGASQAPVVAGGNQNVTASTVATAESASTGASKRALTFQIAPRGGFGQILGNSTYQAKGKYAAGLKLGVGFGEYFGIQGGYTYGEYGVIAPVTNYYLSNYVYWSKAHSYSSQMMNLKQNTGDLVLKAWLLDSDTMVRPFLTVGAAYSKNYLNYSSSVLRYLEQYGLKDRMGKDTDSSSYMGTAGAGVDVQLTKNIAVTGAFEFYKVLSATVSAPSYTANTASSVYSGATYPYNGTTQYPGSYGGAQYPGSYGGAQYPNSGYQPSYGGATNYGGAQVPANYVPAGAVNSPYNYANYVNNSMEGATQDKTNAAGSLALKSFYTLNFGVTFQF